MNKSSNTLNFKKILLIIFAISFSIIGNKVFASDNVLQAIQVDGVNDSYNIILKSDDVADLKKTIQAPNKMILTLNGIRASKTINTIYNNTSNVDSVVVEPTGEDSVKISIQAANASNAEVKFDTLKTPLGVLEKSAKQDKVTDELVLNGPMNTYKPVYNETADKDNGGLSLSGAASSVTRHLKSATKGNRLNLLMTMGIFGILLISGFKAIKGNDNDIKVGLTQSLKEREIDLYRGGLNRGDSLGELQGNALASQHTSTPQNISVGGNYGLKAYQNGTKSPYVSSEIKRPRPTVSPAPSVNLQQVANSTNFRSSTQNPMTNSMQGTMQNTIQTTAQKTMSAGVKPKTANIDSMKFLESMTKIYEKNGRTDLAQGLKANMKKAKINLA